MQSKKKLIIVFGTRPEAIKMAPLIKELQKYPNHFKAIVCVTGQHRQMLDQVIDIFEIIPDYDLNIMRKGQDLYDVTSSVLLKLRDVIKIEKPDMILVHGDTTTSMAAALAAYYQHIPVAHIEAGLRTNNIYSPWPEEINRQITGRIAKYNFAPTEQSKNNLLKENIENDKIIVTGNTVIDALLMVVNKIKHDSALQEEIIRNINNLGYPCVRDEINKKKIVLITGHRRENFGFGFINICTAIKELVNKYKDVDFIYPMHLNPNVRNPIKEIFSDLKYPNLFFIEPLDYLSFVFLMEKSYLLLTDSGGIQEEAPSLGKPVLVMRDTTERPEAVEAGTVKLVDTDKKKIFKEVARLIEDSNYYNKMSTAVNPYGDGLASYRIVNFLKEI